MIKIISIALVLILSYSVYNYAQEWQIFGSMPVTTYSGTAISEDSLIYILGGMCDSIGQITNLIQRYNPYDTNKWSSIGLMQHSRMGPIAGKYDGEYYIFSGLEDVRPEFYPGHIEKIDSANPGVSVVIDSVEHFLRPYATGTVVRGKCFVIGGFDILNSPSSMAPYIIEYSIDNKEVFNFYVPTFIYELPTLQMSAVIEDTIFIFGGTYNTILNDIYKYDITTHLRNELPIDLLEPRAEGTAINIPNTNKILIIGGTNELGIPLRTTEIFEVTDSGYSIKQGPMINVGRAGLMVGFIDNYIYIFGGYGENFISISTIERLNYDYLVDVIDESPAIPDKINLSQNYPNPFNPETTIEFGITTLDYISIDIYSILGEHIINLVNQSFYAGLYSTTWNGNNKFNQPVPSGVYIYKMRSTSYTESRKMILLR